jgi:hypothetical protein
MKRKLQFITVFLLSMMFSLNIMAQDLMITGVADGPLTGGLPKVLEIYAINDVADLSAYTVKKQTNENTDWSGDYNLTGSATAGDFVYVVYVGGDMLNFTDFFENSLTPEESAVINLNGDDRVGIFDASDALVDIFGEENVDGTDSDWEWKDGWAYRVNGASPSATFALADWTFSGVDGLENGTTNATCDQPFPIGTFTMGEPTPGISITSPVDGSEVYSVDVDIEFDVQNFTVADGTGDGHITYTVDGGTAVDHMTTDPINLTGLTEEQHTVVLELVDNSGASLDPVVTESVTFTVNLSPDPVLSITSPTADQVFAVADVDVTFDVQNFTVADGTGDGHIVYTLDSEASVDHMSTDPIALTGLADGAHTIELELVDNLGVSLDPAVTASVNFEVNTAGPATTPIYDIQYTEAASGASSMVDQDVVVKGLVTAINGDSFWMQDDVGAWNGIYVFNELTDGPAIGDSVQVSGIVVEYYDATQVKDLTDLTVLSSGYTPEVYSATTGELNGEGFESVLVQVEGTNNGPVDGFGQWPVNDGSGNILVDDYLFDYAPTQGNDYRVTGINTYSFEEWKIYPRDAADIEDLGVSTDPAISITSPANGAMIYSDMIDVAFTVSNFVLGTDGKVAYAIDGAAMSYQETDADITFSGLTDGSHTVNLQLVDMSEVALDPVVSASVTFTVNLAGPAITPIYDIQYTTDASGDSPMIGNEVTIEGVVAANFNGSDFGEGYYVQDGAGAWNGLYVYDTDNTPTIGDSVRITGEIDEFFGMTQLESVSDFATINIGGTVADPIIVATNDAGDEQYESCLVRVEDAECTTEQNNYGEWFVNDGSGEVMLKDNGAFTFTESLGEIYNVNGMIAYSYGEYSIHYRIPSDIEVAGAINDAFAANTEVYPNPTHNNLTITNLTDVERVELISVTGQTILNENVTDDIMNINLESLASGIYMLKLVSQTDSRVIRIEKN